MNKVALSIYILILLGSGCARNENQYNEAKSLYNETMKIHDEVMPRMDELYTLELKLKSLQDSLSRDTIGNTSTLHQVNQRLSLIDQASKDMMDWMHSIEDVPDENQKIEWLRRLTIKNRPHFVAYLFFAGRRFSDSSVPHGTFIQIRLQSFTSFYNPS